MHIVNTVVCSALHT